MARRRSTGAGVLQGGAALSRSAELDWPIEPILDPDLLYMRVHRSFVIDGELIAGVFRDRPEAKNKMSTNWERYCKTPEEARAKAKVPVDNGIIALKAGEIRQGRLGVEHSPDTVRLDRSHSDVVGDIRSSEARLHLLGILEWSIPAPGLEQVGG